jgi:hypothetical protein
MNSSFSTVVSRVLRSINVRIGCLPIGVNFVIENFLDMSLNTLCNSAFSVLFDLEKTKSVMAGCRD